jgi:hypothetical protein
VAGTRARYELSEEAAAIVQEIKRRLCDPQCLITPDWNRPFVLVTDWCEQGIGAILGQVTEDTEALLGPDGFPLIQPVAFISRACSLVESRYHNHRGEALAIFWAVDKFGYYLHGHRFEIRTDSHSVAYMKEAIFKDAQVFRWVMDMMQYDFEIAHIPGVTKWRRTASHTFSATHGHLRSYHTSGSLMLEDFHKLQHVWQGFGAISGHRIWVITISYWTTIGSQLSLQSKCPHRS